MSDRAPKSLVYRKSGTPAYYMFRGNTEEEGCGSDDEPKFECPFCTCKFAAGIIDEHAMMCVNGGCEKGSESGIAFVSSPPPKRQCQVDLAAWCGAATSPPTNNTTPKTSRGNAEKISPFRGDTQQAKLKNSTRDVLTPALVASAVSSGVEASCSSSKNTVAKPKLLGPLAERVRPQNLSSFVGQEHILGIESQLRKLISSGEVKSMIMWGPPGCGKTSLAKVIAGTVKEKDHRFTMLSAATSGIADVKEIVKHAKTDLQLFRRRTILFLDEIHRFNKLQQDIFLPYVEDGTITLIGATTENPSFALNSALLSRCRVVVMNKLEAEHVRKILHNALDQLMIGVVEGDNSGRQLPHVTIAKSAVALLSNMCDGDARAALNCLEYCVQSKASDLDSKTITDQEVKESLQRSHLLYDKTGEEHYNCISALHKSMRGDDANAALYWLGRMLEGGEDPLYVARRLIRFSSEDIGLADPNALIIAVAAYQACHSIGMPECEVILAQCVTHLAGAPKSTSVYSAYERVKSCIKSHEGPLPGVPLHLRNAPTKLMKDIGYGKGYKYNPSHAGPVEQQYMPDGMEAVTFFD